MIESQLIYKTIVETLAIIAVGLAFPLGLTGCILACIRGWVKRHLIETLKSKRVIELPGLEQAQADEIRKILAPQIKCKIEQSLVQAELMEYRVSGLKNLTRTIAIIEFLMFMFVTSLLLKEDNFISVSGIKVLGAFLGGWMGIKLLMKHDTWSDPAAGKAYYYISLLGTFINFLAASFAAWLITIRGGSFW